MKMGCSEIEEDFFDTRDVFASLSDSGSECSSEDCSTSGFGYDYWVGNLDSVDERRHRFLRSIGLSSQWIVRDGELEHENDDFRGDLSSKWIVRDGELEHENDDFRGDLNSKWLVRDGEKEHENESFRGRLDEIRENPEPTMPENSDFQDGFLVRQPSLSCWSNKAIELVSSGSVKENPSVNTGNRDESCEDMLIKKSFDFGTDVLMDCKRNFGSSSQHSTRKESDHGSLLDRRKKVKKGWLQKLNVMARITDQQDEAAALKPSGKNSNGVACTHAVRVHTHKKKSKELSSLYATQDFSAHNGSISVLKFSHDGRYLASAGEDGIVRIWEVSEDENPRKYEIQENDPSSLYFSANHLSELAPLKVDKEKPRKITGLRKSSELTCVILPPKVFRILEKPVHEFHGHGGEILSLSWSRKGYLLSSSVDKTVRMWHIGHDECLKVFTHSNYVTCVEFNPMDENNFISGSIDGKVRIWEVRGCQVIDWIDIREIVTAVCYYPNGKGSIVGTLDGNCSFYDIIDNRLHLDAQISIMSKKKWPRRITGFQFCPTDSRKVIVSSADSQVRILCGINIVGKFKGNRSAGSQMSASFTADGKHIVSAGEDSNVYMWNHISSDKLYTKAKSNLSYESFFSQNASVAIPWCGIKSIAAAFPSPRATNANDILPRSTIDSPRMPSSSINRGFFKSIAAAFPSPRATNANDVLPRSTIDSPRMPSSSINRSFFLDSLLKSSPTWPAESLPDSTQVSVSPSMRKSEYKFLRSAYQSTFVAPHTWGLVIVAASLDGRIRTHVNYGLPIRL